MSLDNIEHCYELSIRKMPKFMSYQYFTSGERYYISSIIK
ncbi:hypothetical protein GPSY_1728 [Paraglaciecola psychrophila 170]|nr:hypothetical protein GPSY_1728 [Paraglaciecola psychrophila 170]